MPKLFDHDRKAIVDVPEQEVNNLVKSGRFAFKQDEEIPVVSPDGTKGLVKGSEIRGALESGFSYRSQAQMQFDEDEKEFGNSPLSAGALGAARGLSFGLSDVALTQSGLVKPETIQKYKDFNPGATTVGDIAGSIAPVLLSGGTSALASGARAAGAGVLAVDALGQMAARKTVAGLAKAGASSALGSKLAGSAASGLVQSAFYSTGQLVSEAALGDAPSNAEAVISQIGMGALFGGALGAGTSALGSGVGTTFNKGKQSLSSLVKKMLPEESSVSNTALKMLGQVSDDAINKYRAAPERIDAAIPIAEVADKAAEKLDFLRDKVGMLRDEAMDTLATSGVKLRSKFIDRKIMNTIDEFDAKFATDEMKNFARKLKDVKDQLGTDKRKAIRQPTPFDEVNTVFKGGKPFGRRDIEFIDRATGKKSHLDVYDDSRSLRIFNLKGEDVSPENFETYYQSLKAFAKKNGRKEFEFHPHGEHTGFPEYVFKREFQEESKKYWPKKVVLEDLASDGTLNVDMPDSPFMLNLKKAGSHYEIESISAQLSKSPEGYAALNKMITDSERKLGAKIVAAEDLPESRLLSEFFDFRRKDSLKVVPTESRVVSSMGLGEAVAGAPGPKSKLVPSFEEPEDVKRILRYLDDEAKPIYNKMKLGQSPTQTEGRILKLRGEIDELLKKEIPEYREAMKPLASATDTLKRAEKIFGNRDKSEKRLSNIVRKGDEKVTLDTLEKFSQEVSTPEDPFNIRQLIDDRLTLEAFSKDATRGSKNVVRSGLALSGIGGLSAGPIGGLVGAGAGAVLGSYLDKNSGAWIKELIKLQNRSLGPLTKLEKSIGSYSQSIEKTVGDFFDKRGSTLSKLPSYVGAQVADSKSHKDYDDLEKMVTDLSSGIEGGLIDLRAQLKNFHEAAPETGQNMEGKMIQGVALLQEKLPKKISVSFGSEIRPSRNQVAQFLRYYNAVENPNVILNNISKGQVIPEEVEVLRRIYPETFFKLQDKFVEKLGDADLKLPYKKRMEFAKLFSIKTDSFLTPEAIQSLQNNYETAGQGQGQTQMPSAAARSPRFSKEIRNRNQTRSQELEREL